jgi:hypothetical protein
MKSHTAFLTSLFVDLMASSTATAYQIYLGRDIPTPQLGHEETRRVSDKLFNKFVKQNIVPRFKSFSINQGVGYWNGDPEDVSIITVISEHYFDAIDVHKIAKEYCKQFNQEAVFINSLSCFPSLVLHD